MKKFLCAIVLTICLISANVPFSHATSAAVKPVVSIVSPSSDTVYTKDLLISLRVSEAKTLRLKVFDSTGAPTIDPKIYETTSSLNFYTTQIYDIKPGTYKILIEELDASQIVTAKYETKVTVKEKQNTTSGSIFSPPAQSNTPLQVIQTIIKNVFGSEK